MILNVIDRRKNKYKWKEITAIFEPTCHDNSIANTISEADKTEHTKYDGVGYDEIEKCSLEEAIQAGLKNINYLTLFIYDLGEGIKETK